MTDHNSLHRNDKKHRKLVRSPERCEVEGGYVLPAMLATKSPASFTAYSLASSLPLRNPARTYEPFAVFKGLDKADIVSIPPSSSLPSSISLCRKPSITIKQYSKNEESAPVSDSFVETLCRFAVLLQFFF